MTTMTGPGNGTQHSGVDPVGHTGARHRALASVRDGAVRYDSSRAQWMLHRSGMPEAEPVLGSRQRTLRDLTDRGLVERQGPAFEDENTTDRVVLTERGRGALALWGPTAERL